MSPGTAFVAGKSKGNIDPRSHEPWFGVSPTIGAQQQEQAREPASAGRTACGTALGSRCCGCRRPHPLGRRTARQNDLRRHLARRAERHVLAFLSNLHSLSRDFIRSRFRHLEKESP